MSEASAECDPRPSIGYAVPPKDVLRDVFTPAVRQKWRAKPTDELIRRLEILTACGPYPSDPATADELRHNRARKAAREAYLYTAFACGFFSGHRGNDLRRRLASRGTEEFLAAMAECMTCWFLAGKHKFPLSSEAPGRNARNLDMRISFGTLDAGVEVKAPYREPPTERAWHGDDSDKIVQAMDAANKQFADDRPNILCLVPRLRRTIYKRRSNLLRASFGQSKITWNVNFHTGQSGPTKVKFFPDGRFLNTRKPKGGPLKRDGLPAYRRISAIVCIEETIVERYPFPDSMALLDEGQLAQLWPLWERTCDLHFSLDNRMWIEHHVLVLHNPYAYHAISHELFCRYPQLVPVGEKMQWTDGASIVV